MVWLPGVLSKPGIWGISVKLKRPGPLPRRSLVPVGGGTSLSLDGHEIGRHALDAVELGWLHPYRVGSNIHTACKCVPPEITVRMQTVLKSRSCKPAEYS